MPLKANFLTSGASLDFPPAAAWAFGTALPPATTIEAAVEEASVSASRRDTASKLLLVGTVHEDDGAG